MRAKARMVAIATGAVLAVSGRAWALDGTSTLITGAQAGFPTIGQPYITWWNGDGLVRYYDERDGSTHVVDAGDQPSIGDGHLVYRCSDGNNICTYDFATGARTQLTNDTVSRTNPTISSTLVAWVEEQNGSANTAVQVYDLASGTTTTITGHGHVDGAVARGTHLLYMDLLPNYAGYALYLYDATDGSTHTLSTAAHGYQALDLNHIVALTSAGNQVFDFNGTLLATLDPNVDGIARSISGDWVTLLRTNSGTSTSLALWRWTTNQLFETNAASPDPGGGPDSPAIDGTTVVYSNHNSSGLNDGIYSFVFTAPPPPQITFADNFDNCTSTTDLGPNWELHGTWYCKAQRARGEHVTLGVAVAKTEALQDTSVQGLVQLNSSDGSGLVARADGPTFYALRILRAGQVQIVKVDGSTVTVLGHAAHSIADSVSYTLRLDVTGTSPAQLTAYFNGSKLFAATDANGLTGGRAGLLHGSGYRTQFDNFTLSGTVGQTSQPPPPPPPPPPPSASVSFSDDFESCTSITDLGSNWTISGTWYCKSGEARGESPAGLALAKGTATTDLIVTGRVQLTGSTTGSGVVARANGNSYYAARLLQTGHVQIIRVNAGTETLLADVPATIQPEPASYRLALQVTGSDTVTLTASLSGTAVATATDSTSARFLYGQAGLLSGPGGRTQYDSFSAQSP